MNHGQSKREDSSLSCNIFGFEACYCFSYGGSGQHMLKCLKTSPKPTKMTLKYLGQHMSKCLKTSPKPSKMTLKYLGQHIFYSSWSSPEAKFLVQGFEVAQGAWAPLNSLSKECRHVGSHVIFSSMYKVLYSRTLGRSVNHHWTRVSLSANHISEFP
jgi:hypothetical protein